MAKNQWFLFYVRARDMWGVTKMEITAKEFTNELDMLVWASKMRTPKGTKQNYVVGPDGMASLPHDLYERIEVLRKQEAEKEAKLREKEEQRQRRIDNLKKAREAKRQKKEEIPCQAT